MGSVSPVLIVGFPRSGTTLLRTAINNHSRVSAYPDEAFFLLEVYHQLGNQSFGKEAALEAFLGARVRAEQNKLREVIRRAYQGTSEHTLNTLMTPMAQALCQKTAKGDVQKASIPVLKFGPFASRLEIADYLLPGVRVLHIVRDPRGAVASHLARWPDGPLWFRVQEWREAVRQGHDWGKKNQDRYFEVRFEDMLEQPEYTFQSICTFIGVRYSKRMVNLDYVTPQFGTHALEHGQAKHFSTFEPKKVDQWKQTLTAFQIKLIEHLCSEEMDMFGYTRTPSRVRAWESISYGIFYLREGMHYLLSRIWQS